MKRRKYKKIATSKLKKIIASLCIEANYYLEKNIIELWLTAKEKETSKLAKLCYDVMLSNAYLSYLKKKPLCQDTGQLIFFVEHSNNYLNLDKYIEEGVKLGSISGYLRECMVNGISRTSSGFLPITIHKELKKNNFKITVLPTGGGCEQVSATAVLIPDNIEERITEFVLTKVKEAGSLPCPPIFLGIGIGENIETASYIARRALYHLFTEPQYQLSTYEQYLLEQINALCIGPQGIGGNITCFKLKLEASCCHRANLPISVIFSCHLGRYKQFDLSKQSIGDEHYKLLEGIKLDYKDYKKITLPLTEDKIMNLCAGELVLLNGTVYTARDITHKKLIKEEELPFDLKGSVIYYAGPSPAKPGEVIGACGPTTSRRLDAYVEYLLKKGLKGMIGKGERSISVKSAIKDYKAVYFITYGGAGAYLSEKITNAELIAYRELGCEGIFKLAIADFPCIVAYDAYGGSVW